MDDVKKIKVLIVEDSKIALKIATVILATFHCEIHSAELAADAIKLVNKNQFDIIFMDIGLPDMDGISLSQHIRQMEDGKRHTPIVALTAHTSEEAKETAELSMLDDYLQKPISIEIVEKVLHQFNLLKDSAE